MGGCVCTQGTLGSSVKRALLFRPLPSRDQDGKYTGFQAPSPLLLENPPQTVQEKGLDLITHCGICPHCEERKLQSIHMCPSMLLKRQIIYYVGYAPFQLWTQTSKMVYVF